MSRNWKLTAKQLQDMLLVRKVIISPLIDKELEKDEASENVIERGAQTVIEDSEVHEIPRSK